MPYFPRIDKWTQSFCFISTPSEPPGTASEQKVELPTYRLQSGSRSSVVVWEIVKIICLPGQDPSLNRYLACSLTTSSRALHAAADIVAYPSDPSCIYSKFINLGNAVVTRTDDFTRGWSFNDAFDCTDDTGRGMLVAVDSLYVQMYSPNADVSHAFHWRLEYRFVRVPLAEYIGIVQQQQSGLAVTTT